MSSHERKEWFSWQSKKLKDLTALCKDTNVTRYEMINFIDDTYNELYDKDKELMKPEDTSYIGFHKSFNRILGQKKQYIDLPDDENVKIHLKTF